MGPAAFPDPVRLLRGFALAAGLALAAVTPAQQPPASPPPPVPGDIDLTKIPDELLTPEGRRQKEQLRRGADPGSQGVGTAGGGLPAGGAPGGTGAGAPAGDGGAAAAQAQSLLDTAEPIIPRANRDLEAILAHATALKALADACNAAECPVVTTCATAAALAQSLVDAETYLDAMLGALNRAAADSAAAHSNVVAQARITSVNLDRAIRSLALQEYFNKLSSMLFNIASLVDDINNMVKEGKLTPGDNWAAKADGFYEAAKDLEGVMTDGFKLGAELAGGDPDMVKTPVGELTNQVFGTGEKTGLANDVKSSASDAANAIDELRKKAKEAKDAGKPLDGKDVLGGLAKAAGKIVYRDLKLISDRMIKESKEYVDELLKNLKAEERILADLFLQRMRIGERRFVAEDALARVRAAKTALLGCLSRSCGNPSLTRPRLPDYYAAPPGLRAEDLAKHFGWGTALRDLNPRVAAVEIALRERFTVTDSCPGGGGGGVDVRPGGIGVIPGIDPRIRELFRANCPECQPAADRLAAVLTERKFVDGEIARIEANLREAEAVRRSLADAEQRLRELDRRRDALRERIRNSLLRDIEAQQDLAVADGARVELVGEIGFLRREVERLTADEGLLPGLRDRAYALIFSEFDAKEALRVCEALHCQPVVIDTVIGITGTNPFDPNNPIGVVGTGPSQPPPADGPGAVQFASPAFSGGEGGAVAVIVVRTGGAKGAVGVGYATAPGTAASGADFAPASGTLSWADGDASARTIAIALADDTLVEGTETFTVTLSSPTGGATLGSPAAATVSIADNDSPPQQPAGSIQFSASTYSTAENQGAVTITATRTGGANGTVTVQYFTGPSSATAGADYQAANGTLAWENGDASPKSFTVPIVNDTLVEGPETFFVTLNSPTGGATLGAPATATVTIADDDVATGPCGSQGNAWQPNTGASYVCSGNCDPCPSPQTITVNGDRVTVSPFHAGGAATFTGCSPSLQSDSSTLTYFGQSNHRATITRTSNNAFSANIVSSGGGSCSMSCFRVGP